MKITIIYNRWDISYLKKLLAGDESRASNPVYSDFIIVGQRLEKLGFNY